MSGKYHGAVDTFTETQSLETYTWRFSNVSFSFSFLPGKCQWLCNNSQVSEAPAACPAEYLPWDSVDETEREYQCHWHSFGRQPLCCVPRPGELYPAIVWICSYTMDLKVRLQINPSLLPNPSSIPKWEHLPLYSKAVLGHTPAHSHHCLFFASLISN